MAIPIEMPKMSDTMEEGVLVAWLAEEGDTVSAGDVIAQVETDKATMDLEVYDDGVLLKKMAEEGDSIALGELIAVLGKEGEDISDLLAKHQGGGDGAATEAPAEPEPSAAPEAVSGDGAAAAQASAAKGRIKASPLARRLASDHDVALGDVQGSGPEGRIIKRDIEAIVAGREEAASAPAPVAQESAAPVTPSVQPMATEAPEHAYETERISQMRKTISRRLSQSKFTSPHFYLTIDLEMEKMVAFRTQVNELSQAQGGSKVSFNDLVTKACALALKQHPAVNASYMEKEGEIWYHKAINVAVAVAIDEGLMTPVIRNADQKGLGQIATETRALAKKARERTIQPSEYQGSTFTTSNLGMFGIENFTAIINPPNACIMAIGAIRDVPVVKDGEVVPGKRMKVTLSCDHRVVDGAVGAQFLATFRTYIEEPLNLML